MPRLPYVDPERAPEPVRETFARLPAPLNIFRMLAHAETCFRPMLRLGSSILAEQQLDALLRELAILRAVHLCSGEYEWVQHVPIARSLGATEEQMRALEKGAVDHPAFDARERAVLRFTGEVVERVKASDAVFADLAGHLSPREIVELILTIGYYTTMARLTENTETDLDAPLGDRIVRAARESE